MLAEGSRGRSSILGRSETLAAPAAALCNGTATHGFELDDLLDEAIVHPGAIVVPAALAAAEAIDAPGSRLLLGIIAGYEAGNRVDLAIGVEPARRGHHQTALAGPLASVMAAGVVMNLSPEQLTAAVGPACSTSSGTKSFAAGTGRGRLKRMHAGRAAEAGVRMAQLAARGFTAPPSALDGRFGLLEVLSGNSARPGQLALDLGKRWAVEQVYVKVYPCCAWIQATVQQLVAMRGAHPVKAEDVKKLRIGVCSYAARNNGNVAPPDTWARNTTCLCAAALTAIRANPRCASASSSAIVAARLARRIGSRSIRRWRRPIRNISARASISSSRMARRTTARCSIPTECRRIRAATPSGSRNSGCSCGTACRRLAPRR